MSKTCDLYEKLLKYKLKTRKESAYRMRTVIGRETVIRSFSIE